MFCKTPALDFRHRLLYLFLHAPLLMVNAVHNVLIAALFVTCGNAMPHNDFI